MIELSIHIPEIKNLDGYIIDRLILDLPLPFIIYTLAIDYGELYEYFTTPTKYRKIIGDKKWQVQMMN